MTSLVWRAGIRHLLFHRWQAILSVISIALGVAVVIGVDLINASSRQVFEQSQKVIHGSATHTVTGGPGGLDETLPGRLKRSGFPDINPVVSRRATINGYPVSLVGVDLISTLPDVNSRGADILPVLTQPGAVLMTLDTASRLQATPGHRIDMIVSGMQRRGFLVDILDTDNHRAAVLDGVVITDIATAQELTGTFGSIDRIDVRLEADAEQRFTAELPADAVLSATGQHAADTVDMARAFHINLFAMGLLALLVGMFLIYNTMTFSVVQRRPMLATLRALGVTRAGVLRQLLTEAFVAGMLGAVGGAGLGILLAHGLTTAVTRTLNDHYFSVASTTLLITPEPLIKGIVAGLAAALAATAVPAWEAAMTPPQTTQQRSSFETAQGERTRLMMVLATGAAISSILVLKGSEGLIPGFAGLFLMVAAFALAIPWLTVVLSRLVTRVLSGAPPTLRMAVSAVAKHPGRTCPAIAALSIAVATAIGVGVMISSFRQSVDHWLSWTLRADIYVSSPFGESERSSGTLPAGSRERLAALNGVRDVSSGRRITLTTEVGDVEVLALNPASSSLEAFRLTTGGTGADLSELHQGSILISEPLASKLSLSNGNRQVPGSLSIKTPDGPKDFPLAGVFRDYGSEHGKIMMLENIFHRDWGLPGYSTVGLYLEADAGIDRVVDHVYQIFHGSEAVTIRKTAEIRERSMEVFDRTFVVTEVLRVLALIVAFIGIVSALMSLGLERTREYAILRALGFLPRQCGGLIIGQTLYMGVCSALFALPLGATMAVVLIDVINRRSFGWSIDFTLPWPVVFQAFSIALTAALAAGIWPAIRTMKAVPAMVLRDE